MHRRCFHALALAFALTSPLAAADPAEKWAGDLRRMEEADRRTPPPQDAVVFAGSSSIRLWNLKTSFPDLTLVNRGFGGSTIPDNTALADRLIVPLRPRAIVFYAGDNDLTARDATAARTADDFKTFVDKVHAALPGTPILFLSIKHSIARKHLRPLQAEANRLIAAFCASRPEQLHYVDLDASLLGKDGAPDQACFAKDGLHLNEAGYARWAPIVRKALDAALARRRPTP